MTVRTPAAYSFNAVDSQLPILTTAVPVPRRSTLAPRSGCGTVTEREDEIPDRVTLAKRVGLCD